MLFGLFVSCSKNNGGKDSELPAIVIVSPTNNQLFNGGETVTINATLTDNKRIAEVHVHVTNNTSGALLMDIHRYPNSANYALSESFIAQAGIQYKIQLLVKDNSANENNASVLISCN